MMKQAKQNNIDMRIRENNLSGYNKCIPVRHAYDNIDPYRAFQ